MIATVPTTLLSVLVFCRVVIGLVFAISSVSKVKNSAQFKQTITSFALLPASFSQPLAITFVGGEFAVVLLTGAGGVLLLPGFLLAVFLLLIFCIALLTVLFRGMTTSCNCFGTSTQPISFADIWRNGGFLLCALGGCILAPGSTDLPIQTSLVVWILAGSGALIFVAIWLHIGEIAQLFRLN